ncbi:hypothetical protein VPHF86_0018 [Vibrio phage F86]
MQNVKAVRKARITDTFVGKNMFRAALVELLIKRDNLSVYDLVYSLNGGEFDETLRRRVHYVLTHNEDVFEASGIVKQDGVKRPIRLYSMKGRSKTPIEKTIVGSPRAPIRGMEKLLTDVLSGGLGEAVRRGGPDMVQAFRDLDAKQQAHHIAALTLTKYPKKVVELVGASSLSDLEVDSINLRNVVLSNAHYVVRTVNKTQSFFSDIQDIYG